MQTVQVAIDGPAGSGKSTIGKLLAKKLNFVYLDTGGMYRSYALAAQNENIDLNDPSQIEYLIAKTDINIDEYQQFYLNGVNVTEQIRTPVISELASIISTIKRIREVAVEKQRKMAENVNVVMDGRDIGSVVLPNAQLKIFLNASVDERVKRRMKELLEKGQMLSHAEITAKIKERDERDYNRKESPLKKMPEAFEIVTDNLEIEQVVEKIYQLVKGLAICSP